MPVDGFPPGRAPCYVTAGETNINGVIYSLANQVHGYTRGRSWSDPHQNHQNIRQTTQPQQSNVNNYVQQPITQPPRQGTTQNVTHGATVELRNQVSRLIGLQTLENYMNTSVTPSHARIVSFVTLKDRTGAASFVATNCSDFKCTEQPRAAVISGSNSTSSSLASYATLQDRFQGAGEHPKAVFTGLDAFQYKSVSPQERIPVSNQVATNSSRFNCAEQPNGSVISRSNLITGLDDAFPTLQQRIPDPGIRTSYDTTSRPGFGCAQQPDTVLNHPESITTSRLASFQNVHERVPIADTSSVSNGVPNLGFPQQLRTPVISGGNSTARLSSYETLQQGTPTVGIRTSYVTTNKSYIKYTEPYRAVLTSGNDSTSGIASFETPRERLPVGGTMTYLSTNSIDLKSAEQTGPILTSGGNSTAGLSSFDTLQGRTTVVGTRKSFVTTQSSEFQAVEQPEADMTYRSNSTTAPAPYATSQDRIPVSGPNTLFESGSNSTTSFGAIPELIQVATPRVSFATSRPECPDPSQPLGISISQSTPAAKNASHTPNCTYEFTPQEHPKSVHLEMCETACAARRVAYVPNGEAEFKRPEQPKPIMNKTKGQRERPTLENSNFDPKSPAPPGGFTKEFIDFIQSPRVPDAFDEEEDEEEAGKFWICDADVYKRDQESRRQSVSPTHRKPFVVVSTSELCNTPRQHPIINYASSVTRRDLYDDNKGYCSDVTTYKTITETASNDVIKRFSSDVTASKIITEHSSSDDIKRFTSDVTSSKFKTKHASSDVMKRFPGDTTKPTVRSYDTVVYKNMVFHPAPSRNTSDTANNKDVSGISARKNSRHHQNAQDSPSGFGFLDTPKALTAAHKRRHTHMEKSLEEDGITATSDTVNNKDVFVVSVTKNPPHHQNAEDFASGFGFYKETQKPFMSATHKRRRHENTQKTTEDDGIPVTSDIDSNKNSPAVSVRENSFCHHSAPASGLPDTPKSWTAAEKIKRLVHTQESTEKNVLPAIVSCHTLKSHNTEGNAVSENGDVAGTTPHSQILDQLKRKLGSNAKSPLAIVISPLHHNTKTGKPKRRTRNAHSCDETITKTTAKAKVLAHWQGSPEIASVITLKPLMQSGQICTSPKLSRSESTREALEVYPRSNDVKMSSPRKQSRSTSDLSQTSIPIKITLGTHSESNHMMSESRRKQSNSTSDLHHGSEVCQKPLGAHSKSNHMRSDFPQKQSSPTSELHRGIEVCQKALGTYSKSNHMKSDFPQKQSNPTSELHHGSEVCQKARAAHSKSNHMRSDCKQKQSSYSLDLYHGSEVSQKALGAHTKIKPTTNHRSMTSLSPKKQPYYSLDNFHSVDLNKKAVSTQSKSKQLTNHANMSSIDHQNHSVYPAASTNNNSNNNHSSSEARSRSKTSRKNARISITSRHKPSITSRSQQPKLSNSFESWFASKQTTSLEMHVVGNYPPPRVIFQNSSPPITFAPTTRLQVAENPEKRASSRNYEHILGISEAHDIVNKVFEVAYSKTLKVPRVQREANAVTSSNYTLAGKYPHGVLQKSPQRCTVSSIVHPSSTLARHPVSSQKEATATLSQLNVLQKMVSRSSATNLSSHSACSSITNPSPILVNSSIDHPLDFSVKSKPKSRSTVETYPDEPLDYSMKSSRRNHSKPQDHQVEQKSPLDLSMPMMKKNHIKFQNEQTSSSRASSTPVIASLKLAEVNAYAVGTPGTMNNSLKKLQHIETESKLHQDKRESVLDFPTLRVENEVQHKPILFENEASMPSSSIVVSSRVAKGNTDARTEKQDSMSLQTLCSRAMSSTYSDLKSRSAVQERSAERCVYHIENEAPKPRLEPVVEKNIHGIQPTTSNRTRDDVSGRNEPEIGSYIDITRTESDSNKPEDAETSPAPPDILNNSTESKSHEMKPSILLEDEEGCGQISSCDSKAGCIRTKTYSKSCEIKYTATSPDQPGTLNNDRESRSFEIEPSTLTEHASSSSMAPSDETKAIPSRTMLDSESSELETVPEYAETSHTQSVTSAECMGTKTSSNECMRSPESEPELVHAMSDETISDQISNRMDCKFPGFENIMEATDTTAHFGMSDNNIDSLNCPKDETVLAFTLSDEAMADSKSPDMRITFKDEETVSSPVGKPSESTESKIFAADCQKCPEPNFTRSLSNEISFKSEYLHHTKQNEFLDLDKNSDNSSTHTEGSNQEQTVVIERVAVVAGIISEEDENDLVIDESQIISCKSTASTTQDKIKPQMETLLSESEDQEPSDKPVRCSNLIESSIYTCESAAPKTQDETSLQKKHSLEPILESTNEPIQQPITLESELHGQDCRVDERHNLNNMSDGQDDQANSEPEINEELVETAVEFSSSWIEDMKEDRASQVVAGTREDYEVAKDSITVFSAVNDILENRTSHFDAKAPQRISEDEEYHLPANVGLKEVTRVVTKSVTVNNFRESLEIRGDNLEMVGVCEQRQQQQQEFEESGQVEMRHERLEKLEQVTGQLVLNSGDRNEEFVAMNAKSVTANNFMESRENGGDDNFEVVGACEKQPKFEKPTPCRTLERNLGQVNECLKQLEMLEQVKKQAVLNSGNREEEMAEKNASDSHTMNEGECQIELRILTGTPEGENTLRENEIATSSFAEPCLISDETKTEKTEVENLLVDVPVSISTDICAISEIKLEFLGENKASETRVESHSTAEAFGTDNDEKVTLTSAKSIVVSEKTENTETRSQNEEISTRALVHADDVSNLTTVDAKEFSEKHSTQRFSAEDTNDSMAEKIETDLLKAAEKDEAIPTAHQTLVLRKHVELPLKNAELFACEGEGASCHTEGGKFSKYRDGDTNVELVGDTAVGATEQPGVTTLKVDPEHLEHYHGSAEAKKYPHSGSQIEGGKYHIENKDSDQCVFEISDGKPEVGTTAQPGVTVTEVGNNILEHYLGSDESIREQKIDSQIDCKIENKNNATADNAESPKVIVFDATNHCDESTSLAVMNSNDEDVGFSNRITLDKTTECTIKIDCGTTEREVISDDLILGIGSPPEKMFHQERRFSETLGEFLGMNEPCCDEYDNMFLTEDESDYGADEPTESETENFNDHMVTGDVVNGYTGNESGSCAEKETALQTEKLTDNLKAVDWNTGNESGSCAEEEAVLQTEKLTDNIKTVDGNTEKIWIEIQLHGNVNETETPSDEKHESETENLNGNSETSDNIEGNTEKQFLEDNDVKERPELQTEKLNDNSDARHDVYVNNGNQLPETQTKTTVSEVENIAENVSQLDKPNDSIEQSESVYHIEDTNGGSADSTFSVGSSNVVKTGHIGFAGEELVDEKVSENNSLDMGKNAPKTSKTKRSGLREKNSEKTDCFDVEGTNAEEFDTTSPSTSISNLLPHHAIVNNKFGYGVDALKRKSPLKLGYNVRVNLSRCDVKVKRRKLVKKDETPTPPKVPKTSPKRATYILLSDSSSEETEGIFKTKKVRRKSRKKDISNTTSPILPNQKSPIEMKTAALVPSVKDEPIEPITTEYSNSSTDDVTTPKFDAARKVVQDIQCSSITHASDSQESRFRSSRRKMEHTCQFPNHDTLEQSLAGTVEPVSKILSSQNTIEHSAITESRKSFFILKTKRNTIPMKSFSFGIVENSGDSPPSRKSSHEDTSWETSSAVVSDISDHPPFSPPNNRAPSMDTSKSETTDIIKHDLDGEERPTPLQVITSWFDSDVCQSLLSPTASEESDKAPPKAIPLKSYVRNIDTDESNDSSVSDGEEKVTTRGRQHADEPKITNTVVTPDSESGGDGSGEEYTPSTSNKLPIKKRKKRKRIQTDDLLEFASMIQVARLAAPKQTSMQTLEINSKIESELHIGLDNIDSASSEENIVEDHSLDVADENSVPTRPGLQSASSIVSDEEEDTLSTSAVPGIFGVSGLEPGSSYSQHNDDIDADFDENIIVEDRSFDDVTSDPTENAMITSTVSKTTERFCSELDSCSQYLSVPEAFPTGSGGQNTLKQRESSARIKGNWKSMDIPCVTKLKIQPLPCYSPEKLSKAERNQNIFSTMQKLIDIGLVEDRTPRSKTSILNSQRNLGKIGQNGTGYKLTESLKQSKKKLKWFSRKRVNVKPCTIPLKKLNIQKYDSNSSA